MPPRTAVPRDPLYTTLPAARRLTLALMAVLGACLLVPGRLARAQDAGGAWHEVRRKEGVRVELRHTGLRTPDSRGSARLPYGLPLLREVLLELRGYGRRWPYLGTSRLLRRGAADALLYCRTKLPFPFSDRDWTMRVRWQDQPGRFTLSWDALPGGTGPAQRRGVIRLDHHSGHWELVARGANVTDVRYVRRGDLGGRLPQRIRLAVAREEPVAMIRALHLSARGWR